MSKRKRTKQNVTVIYYNEDLNRFERNGRPISLKSLQSYLRRELGIRVSMKELRENKRKVADRYFTDEIVEKKKKLIVFTKDRKVYERVKRDKKLKEIKELSKIKSKVVTKINLVRKYEKISGVLKSKKKMKPIKKKGKIVGYDYMGRILPKKAYVTTFLFTCKVKYSTEFSDEEEIVEHYVAITTLHGFADLSLALQHHSIHYPHHWVLEVEVVRKKMIPLEDSLASTIIDVRTGEVIYL